VAGTVDAHPHLTLPGGAHGIDRAADPTPRLLDVAEDNARLLGQAGVRRGPEGGRTGPGRPGLSLTMRERWQGRPGSPSARAAGGWLARTGSLPAGLPVEVNDGDRLLAAALGQLDAGDPGGAGVLEQLRDDHPAAPALPRPKGGRRWPSGRRPLRRSGSPMGLGCWLAPGPTSAAAGCGPTSSPGEVETLVAAGLEPCDALAAATINGGRLLGEPGAGVLAQGPGRHPARPRRTPDRPGIAVAGVAHQLVPPHP
jgi:hypothetical protein